jgi:uncharacterized protein (TIGR03086 family)
MAPTPPAAVLVEAPALLERAVGYTRTALTLVTPDLLSARTPCTQWDLGELLQHMDDSLAAFTEAALGYVAPTGPVAPELPGAVGSLRVRACALLGAWSAASRPRTVSVAGRPVQQELLAATGALEIAVHGWDVARACGMDRPLPEELARALLAAAPLVVAEPDRPGRFAAQYDVPADAPAGVRLLGFLGRAA